MANVNHLFSLLNPESAGSAQNLKRRGFTLIELLVVISIIGILAAMLMPALSKSKEKARTSQCLSNEKQIDLAVLMYADEHANILPSTRADATLTLDLGQVTLEYLTLNRTALNNVGNTAVAIEQSAFIQAPVFLCPTALANWGTNNRNMSYICNDHLAATDDAIAASVSSLTNRARKITECTTPVKTALFGDGRYASANPAGCFGYIECWPSTMWPGTFIDTVNGITNRAPLHSGLANMAYADGHVAGENLGTLTNKCSAHTPGGNPNNIWDLTR